MCVHMYAHACVCTCMRVCTYVCACDTQTCYVYACVRVIHEYVCISICVCHTYVYLLVSVHTHTCRYVHMYVICMFVYIQHVCYARRDMDVYVCARTFVYVYVYTSNVYSRTVLCMCSFHLYHFRLLQETKLHTLQRSISYIKAVLSKCSLYILGNLLNQAHICLITFVQEVGMCVCSPPGY